MTITKRTVWQFGGAFYDSEADAKRAQAMQQLVEAFEEPMREIRSCVREACKSSATVDVVDILVDYGGWRLVNALSAALRTKGGAAPDDDTGDELEPTSGGLVGESKT